MRERARRGRGDRYRGVSGGSRGLQGGRRWHQRGKGVPLCVGITPEGSAAAAEPPRGEEARAEIAEGSVVGTTDPVGGASGASGAGIARER